MFDLVQNVFQSLLALHSESEINLDKSESLLWGQQYLADFPRGRLSLFFWETASHVSLLCSFQCAVHWKRKISRPFSVEFLSTAFVSAEACVWWQASKERERNLLYWRNGDKANNSYQLWIQRWYFSSIPLTGFIRCVKLKQTGKG